MNRAFALRLAFNLLVFLLIYLLGAFWMAGFNIAAWPVEVRGFIALSGFVAGFIAWLQDSRL